LRARPVAGDVALNADLAEVRRDILSVPREHATVFAEVSSMRQRWRAERDRSDKRQLDLKQGHGGLLDIEFLLQGLVLANASQHHGLLDVTANAAMIEACRAAELLDASQAAILAVAHADLLQRSLTCTMDLRSRLAPRDAELRQVCAGVEEVAEKLGFKFN